MRQTTQRRFAAACAACLLLSPVLYSAEPPPPAAAGPEVLPLDLPTALKLVNANNPTIALAVERLWEAQVRLRQAEVAWLPDLRGGPAYLRHDGKLQDTIGAIITTNKQSLFVGGGAYLTWDTTNVFFGPLIAQRLVEAQAASTQAVTNSIQLETALAYLELLRVYGTLAINADTLARAEEMLRNAEAAVKAGLGKTPADINRAQTEVSLRRTERIDLQAQAAVASARLARLLLLKPTVDLQPADPAIVPVTLVPSDKGLDDLVALGLSNRPELRESRSLVDAAVARWRQARIQPFVPRLEASYAAGTFGGGINSRMGDFGGRGDGTAQAVWEFTNLGAGDVLRARARRSQVEQANFNVLEVQAQVAEEVTVAAKLARFRIETLASSQDAVREALETWRRLRESQFGVGTGRRYDPIEPLIAVRDLDTARKNYLLEVIEYNRAQFRLYWALGQPVLCALPAAAPVAVETPVVPGGTNGAATLPPPRPLGSDKK
jgi:outer membrane protein TolC